MKVPNQKIQYDEAEALTRIKRVTELWLILHNDTVKALKEMKATAHGDDNLPYRRRTFVRTTFAMIEGVCFGMRDLCKSAIKLPDANRLSDDILEKLSEKKGWLKFEESLTLSFNTFCAVIRKDFELNVQGEGYAALRRAKKLRDRLMHPKRSHEVMLSAAEIEDTRRALDWFAREMERWKWS